MSSIYVMETFHIHGSEDIVTIQSSLYTQYIPTKTPVIFFFRTKNSS